MTPRRLRAGLPFRRVALVLSGGGALGAYEAGVLKVIEALALTPSLVAGVSIGAINAVVWLAHGRRTAPLEEVWRRMRPSNIGLQWVALALRAAGSFAVVIATMEIILTFTGSREFSGSYWIWKKASARIDFISTQLDVYSWLFTAAVGLFVVFLSRPIEGWMSRGVPGGDPQRGRMILGRVALGAFAIHTLVWVMAWPWPHRFSASMVILLALAWLGSGEGSVAHALRRMGLGLMPETGGRGLWGGVPRRRVIEKLVAAGDPSLLVGPGTGLVIGALAVDSGRVCHFTSWPNPGREFEERVRAELGEVVPMRTPQDAIRAAVASSAIPGVFEPERIDGRDFVDAGGFSNQPLHVALAGGADAVIVVLLTPSQNPTPAPPPDGLFALGGRLLELANWRDLQMELRQLPEGWSRDGDPARVCVVEPPRTLPGSVLGFDPVQAAQLITLGEQDAWAAFERAGWLEPEPGQEGVRPEGAAPR